MKQSQRVAKNAVFGVFAAAFGGGLNFLSILLVARFLSLEEFGIFSYLLAFATVFQFLADFGLSNILVREMARRPGDLGLLLGGAKGLLWALFAGALLLMALLTVFLPMEEGVRRLSFAMGLGYLFLLPSVSYVSALRATEDMEFNAVGFVLHKVVLVASLGIALWSQWGLWGVVACHGAANVFQWGFYHWIVTRRYGAASLRCDFTLWKSLIREALPMGGGMALRQFSWQLDIFLLKYLSDALALALFSGPFRILIGMTLLSAVLTVPLFPMFVRLADEARAELAVVYQRAVKGFCLLSFPLMTVCLAWPEVWIRLFLGEKFLGAVPALQVLALAVVPIFISVLFPFLYSALNSQGWYLRALALAVVSRLALGGLLIPRHGALGACLTVVVVEIGLFCVLTARLARMGLPVDFKGCLLKPALASAVLGGVLVLSRNFPPGGLAAAAAGGGLAYIVGLGLLRVFSTREIRLAVESCGFLRPYLSRFRLGGVGGA